MGNTFKYVFNSFYDNNNYQSEINKIDANGYPQMNFGKFIYGMNEYSILGGLSLLAY